MSRPVWALGGIVALAGMLLAAPVTAQDLFDDPVRQQPPLEEPLPQPPLPDSQESPPPARPARPDLEYGAEAVEREPTAFNPFEPPEGMATPMESLLCMSGQGAVKCFVFSPTNCFSLASWCYRRGFYQDAIALLNKAIEQDPQPEYFYLRGMSEMQIGACDASADSAVGVVDTLARGGGAGLDRIGERFNGPVAIQMRELIKLAAQ